MSPRRYDDDEVARILARATATDAKAPTTLARTEGLTLAELQAIGGEVGIAPEQIAVAAREIDRPGQPATRRFLGITVGVGHTRELGRMVDDAEWERFVVLARETFDARGQLRAHGSFREWTNGNLQLHLEPGDGGHRLRMRTLHESARALVGSGGGLALGSLAVMAIAYAVPIGAGDLIKTGGTLAAMGAALAGLGVYRLIGWARTRRRQMEELAARLGSGELSK